MEMTERNKDAPTTERNPPTTMNAPDLGVITPSNAGLVVSDRIAELEARLESILDASEDDMPLAHAEELAALWSAGKLIGGDAHAAAITLRAALAAERERRGSSSPEDIARRFHDAYERLAPQFGYSTRPESRREWDELPQNLRDLMIAVVRNVLIEQPAADAD